MPFEITPIENDLQRTLGRIRGTAIVATAYTERIDAETQWHYRFVVDATNHEVALERLERLDGTDAGAVIDREVVDTDAVEPGDDGAEYERALAQLLRRTSETDSGGLTTSGDGEHGDNHGNDTRHEDDENTGDTELYVSTC